MTPTAACRPSICRPCAPGPPSSPRCPLRADPAARRSADGDPALAELRRVVNDLATTHQLGELMLKAAPAYLSDTAAANILAPLCDQIG
ncbi:hypothetical protein [Streptomyces sp. NPDC026589]|uniref:hypothetical protein n=1 Tax=Streptomyces sp. NPDC026589 TaxID=3155609 RepID=UPI0033D22941